MPTYDFILDENALLHLAMEPVAGGVKCRIYSDYAPERSALVKNLLPLLRFEHNGQVVSPDTPDFMLPAASPLVLKINKQVFSEFNVASDTITEQPKRKLSVCETRMIGRALQNVVPATQRDLSSFPSPVTDLHSHLSGQIGAQDLINIGCKYNIAYPVAALEKLGIAYPQDTMVDIPRRIFLPLAHLQQAGSNTEKAVPVSTLSPEGIKKLRNALSLSPETQSTFEELETCYYLREPFTKDIRLLPEILRKVAESYQRQGIRYAELSSNAVIDPAWLKVIHEVMPDIERDTGVQLRFLAGLPRNLDEAALDARIEKIKRVAASPYITGVDLLGYEMNKTSHLSEHLEGLAQWMRDSHPDMVLRIHAGENPKNLNNVKECLQLAKKYGIRMRIGHAVYGIDDETIALAQYLGAQKKVIMEFNPDSNIAGNNVDFPDEIPVMRFLNSGVPSVLSSDGASLYLTSARQTAQAGLLCDLAPDGFHYVNNIENGHIAEQQRIFDEKQRALPADLFAQANVPEPRKIMPPVSPAPQKPDGILAIKQLIGARRPILIAGAAGSSWDIIKPEDHQEIIFGLRALLEQLDPEKVCFVLGRTKDRGVGIELGKAIADYNRTHEKKFDCAVLMAEGQNGVHERPLGIQHTFECHVPLVFLPKTILNIIKEHDGLAYYIGGRSFTRDFIVESDHQELQYGLMTGVRGASGEKSRVFMDKAYIGAIGATHYMHRMCPEIFTKKFELPELEVLRERLQPRFVGR